MTRPSSPSRILRRGAALGPKTIFMRLGPGLEDERLLTLEAVDALLFLIDFPPP